MTDEIAKCDFSHVVGKEVTLQLAVSQGAALYTIGFGRQYMERLDSAMGHTPRIK